MENNSYIVVLEPTDKFEKTEILERLDDKSQDYLDGYIKALEEFGYNVKLEKVG